MVGLDDGKPGAVMTIHTFGDYTERFHPHIYPVKFPRGNLI
jgi:hypothetical protein